jgi:hypothetical protein
MQSVFKTNYFIRKFPQYDAIVARAYYIYSMKYLISLLFIGNMLVCIAQENGPIKTNGGVALLKTINLQESHLDFNPEILNVDVHPIPSAEYANKKEILLRKRLALENAPAAAPKKTRATAPSPIITKAFAANTTSSTPLDNDIAISNDGKMISVVNSNMRIYDDTGKIITTKSINTMAAAVGNFAYISDPRVLYDPEADRFVLVCFTGTLSNESIILVGFTQTNDPNGNWNFYGLNGGSFNDSTWSDYPIIALSKSDLLMTFNQVKDNVSWTIGFKQSVIWQIDKQKGYNADSLEYTLWSNLQLNGVNYRNICPAKQQSFPYTDTNYFISVRNVDFENDSVFLFTLNNSYKSGTAAIGTQTLISNKKYGFPPNAIQKNQTFGQQYLMTNDARVLAAIYENDRIYFGSNTVNPQFINAGIYLGTIKNVAASPVVTADIFSRDTMEYAYPSMAYMGNSPTDHKVLFGFSHCVKQGFPGNSILYRDALDNYSEINVATYGTSICNVLADSNERWGDYSGIQKKYNTSTKAYMANSSGIGNKFRAWINIIYNAEAPTAVNPITTAPAEMLVYPNPSNSDIAISFYMAQKQKVHIYITDMMGRKLHTIVNDYLKVGNNTFKFSTLPLPKGNYILKLQGTENEIASKLFTVQ